MANHTWNCNKVFVIGRNKTGTTSLAQVLVAMGYVLGDQARAELLLDHWARRDFHAIVDYCKQAEAFQDVPFSIDYTFQIVDYAFPGSKFILSIRNSAQEWYDSLTRFHTLLLGKGRLPTPDDLKQFPYRYPGWLWKAQQLVYGIDESTLYDPDIYMQHYEAHNEKVLDYFKHRPDKLLVLNVAEPTALQRLSDFLQRPIPLSHMPHLNRSA